MKSVVLSTSIQIESQVKSPKKSQVRKFIQALETLPDPRDNRGKTHELAFVLCCVTLAILSDRSYPSSIQRYIKNRINWLKKITGRPLATAVSRAQLPKILSVVDVKALNEITFNHFGVRVFDEEMDWNAFDGKALRGTPDEQGKQKARILTAVNHRTGEIIAQEPINDCKNAEVPTASEVMARTGLDKENNTMDALYLTPELTAQLEKNGGHYIIQVKGNQPILHTTLTDVASSHDPHSIIIHSDKAHGRHEERLYWFFPLDSISFADRWSHSGFRTLIVVVRQTIRNNDPSKISQELSCYISNCSLSGQKSFLPESLAQAIRKHWTVEVINWVRDVTFGEDLVKTKDANLAQVLASIRTFAIRLLQRGGSPNFKAAIETFSDCPDLFSRFLHQYHVL